jgi:hypothetical protein
MRYHSKGYQQGLQGWPTNMRLRTTCISCVYESLNRGFMRGTVDCTHPGADCELVTLVAIIFRVFTQGDCEGKSSLYLESTLVKLTRAPWRVNPHDYVWKLAPRCKSIKQVTNVTDPPTLSQPLPILISRCWISSPTSGFIVGRFCLIVCFLDFSVCCLFSLVDLRLSQC